MGKSHSPLITYSFLDRRMGSYGKGINQESSKQGDLPESKKVPHFLQRHTSQRLVCDMMENRNIYSIHCA